MGCGTASNSSIPTGWLFVDFFSHIHFSIIKEDRMLLARTIFLLVHFSNIFSHFVCYFVFVFVMLHTLNWSEKNALPVHTKSTFCFILKSCKNYQAIHEQQQNTHIWWLSSQFPAVNMKEDVISLLGLSLFYHLQYEVQYVRSCLARLCVYYNINMNIWSSFIEFLKCPSTCIKKINLHKICVCGICTYFSSIVHILIKYQILLWLNWRLYCLTVYFRWCIWFGFNFFLCHDGN